MPETSPIDPAFLTFEHEVLACYDDIWSLDSAEDLLSFVAYQGWRLFQPVPTRSRNPAHEELMRAVMRAPLTESLARLRDCWSESRLGELAMAVFLHRSSWEKRYRLQDRRERRIAHTLDLIAGAALMQYPPDDLAGHLLAAVRRGEACLTAFIEDLPNTPGALDVLEAIATGAAPSYAPNISYLQRLWQADRLSYELFQAIVRAHPFLVETICRVLRPPISAQNDDQASFYTALLAFVRRFAHEFALRPDMRDLLVIAHIGRLSQADPELLLAAARLHAQHWQRPLDCRSSDARVRAIIALAGAAGTLSETQIEELRDFERSTLLALLPFAQYNRPALARLVGWQSAAGCIGVLTRLARVDSFVHTTASYPHDVQASSPDPSQGVVALAQAQAALELVSEQLTRQVFALFAEAGFEQTNTHILLEAVAGWNRAKVEKWVQSKQPAQQQIGAKAYGLLPLATGRDEARERYEVLHSILRDASKHGPQRQASQRAAALAGLANLAQNAGFVDSTHMELRFEAARAEEIPLEVERTFGAYILRVTLSDEDSTLTVLRKGKSLRSVPAELRAAPVYTELRQVQETQRAQLRRFRNAFESLMVAGVFLPPDLLHMLLLLPIARGLLERLVLQDEAGACGMLLAGEMILAGSANKRVPLDRPLRVVHPLLLAALELDYWQEYVQRSDMIQPFPQVFRETFTPSPQERSDHYSLLQAGRILQSALSSRVLPSRGWVLPIGENSVATKLFPVYSVRAFFVFEQVGHYFSELPTVTTGAIYFASEQSTWCEPEEGLPLVEVPTIAFSETLRDGELLAAVATAAVAFHP